MAVTGCPSGSSEGMTAENPSGLSHDLDIPVTVATPSATVYVHMSAGTSPWSSLHGNSAGGPGLTNDGHRTHISYSPLSNASCEPNSTVTSRVPSRTPSATDTASREGPLLAMVVTLLSPPTRTACSALYAV